MKVRILKQDMPYCHGAKWKLQFTKRQRLRCGCAACGSFCRWLGAHFYCPVLGLPCHSAINLHRAESREQKVERSNSSNDIIECVNTSIPKRC